MCILGFIWVLFSFPFLLLPIFILLLFLLCYNIFSLLPMFWFLSILSLWSFHCSIPQLPCPSLPALKASGLSVSDCSCSKLLQARWLTTTRNYSVTVLEVRSLKLVSWVWNQGVSRTDSCWWFQEKIHSLTVPASRECLALPGS